jgi:hypothetical protein
VEAYLYCGFHLHRCADLIHALVDVATEMIVTYTELQRLGCKFNTWTGILRRIDVLAKDMTGTIIAVGGYNELVCCAPVGHKFRFRVKAKGIPI